MKLTVNEPKTIPVGVNVAPIIPGLTDEEIPSILERAAAAGARFASYTIVRLLGPVEPLFLDWLQRELPERAGKIENRIRDTRGGKLTDQRFGKRMKGEGEIAKTIKRLFQIHCEKYGLNKGRFEFATKHFTRGVLPQMELF